MKVLLSFSFLRTGLFLIPLLISGNVAAYGESAQTVEERMRAGAVIGNSNQGPAPVENFDPTAARNAERAEAARQAGAKVRGYSGAPSNYYENQGQRAPEKPMVFPERHEETEINGAAGTAEGGVAGGAADGTSHPPQVGRPRGATVTRSGGASDPSLYRTKEEIEFEAAVADCESSAEKAELACATDKDGNMKSTLDWIDMGTQAGTLITKGTGSIHMACSNLAQALDKASAGLAVIKSICGIAVWNCSRKCTTQMSPIGFRKCSQANERVRGIEVQIATLISQKMDAKNCKEQAKSPQQIFCEKNPGAAACANLADFDCSNPKNGAQLVCKCQLPSSANLPECGGMVTRGTGAGGAGDQTATSASAEQAAREKAMAAAQQKMIEDLAGQAGLAGPGKGDGNGMDPTAQSGGAKGVSASTGDGKGGAGGGRGPGGTRLNTNVNSGSYGGSGGGGFGGGGYGGGGGGNNAGNTRYPSGDPREKFDPSKYLPGNGQVRRISGMTGPDGITGPADNIFSKINNRYRAVGSGLNP